MDFLYLLEDLRTPLLDAVFSALTHLGGETVFLVAALVTFWAVDKRQGYYLLSVGFMGTLVNQFLKITCRIPRPWVRDPRFTIVEAARADATGYSFPSGHSTSSVGTFGVLATESKKRPLRIAAACMCLLIPFTRLYLGVHTPADVLVGSTISLIFLIALRPFIYKKGGRLMPWLLGGMLLLSVAFVGYMELFPFPADVDEANLYSAQKNSYTLLGALVGMIVVYWADRKLDFPTGGVWYAQVAKCILGLAVVLLVKEGLKSPLDGLLGGHLLARAIRYMAVVLTAGILWPLTFPWFMELGRKDHTQ